MIPIGRGLSTGSKWAAFPYPFTGLNKSHPKSRDCEKEWAQAGEKAADLHWFTRQRRASSQGAGGSQESQQGELCDPII